MSELIHLVYASRATRPYRDDDLIRLLNKARSNNLALNVSGMLLSRMFHEFAPISLVSWLHKKYSLSRA